MLLNLLTGLPVMFACLVLQAIFVIATMHYYGRLRLAHEGHDSQWLEIVRLSIVMLLMLLGNMAQMVIWALLFVLLGEFSDFSTAVYHSAVNFVTLGYGDIVMSERWRLLGPLEATNGILMFGVSTAVMTAALVDAVRSRTPSPKERDGPRG